MKNSPNSVSELRISWLGDDAFLNQMRPILPEGWKVAVAAAPEDALDHDAAVLVLAAGRMDELDKSRPGLETLQRLRREFRLRSGAVVYAAEPLDVLRKRYGIVAAPGTTFISELATAEDLTAAIRQAAASELSDAELDDIIRWQSGLQKIWFDLNHKFDYYFKDDNPRDRIFDKITDELVLSVERFAPDQAANLQDFLALVAKENWVYGNNGKLQAALARLTVGLLGTTEPIVPDVRHIKSPPKGFREVLYVDDKPQPRIARALEMIYGYTVTIAETKSSAILKLERDKFGSVLSDLNMALHLRGAEGAVHGLAVMRKAIELSRLAGSSSKPIVICTSYTDPPDDYLPDGVIRCAGAVNSQSVERIHSTIWAAARDLGVDEPDDPEWVKNGILLAVREEALFWKNAIPDLTDQWRGLSESVQNRAVVGGDPKNTPDFLRLLPGVSDGSELSVRNVEQIGKAAERALFEVLARNNSSKMPPEDLVYYGNIHVNFRPFGLAAGCLLDLRHACDVMAESLGRYEPYQNCADDLRDVIDSFSAEYSPVAWMARLDNALTELVNCLPGKEPYSSTTRTGAPTQTVPVYVLDDDLNWRSFTIEALKKECGSHLITHDLDLKATENTDDLIHAFGALSRDEASDDDTLNIQPAAASGPSIIGVVLASSAFLSRTVSVPSPKSGYPDKEMPLARFLADRDVPFLCLSGGGNLPERKLIRKLGLVQEHRFISKSLPRETYLRLLLERFNEMLIQPPKPVIEMITDAHGAFGFRLDDVPVKFGNSDRDQEYKSVLYSVVTRCEPDSGRRYGAKAFRLADIEVEDWQIVQAVKSFVINAARKNFIPIDTTFVSRIHDDLDGSDHVIDERGNAVTPFTYSLRAEVRIVEPENYKDRVKKYKRSPRVCVVDPSGRQYDDLKNLLENSGMEVVPYPAGDTVDAGKAKPGIFLFVETGDAEHSEPSSSRSLAALRTVSFQAQEGRTRYALLTDRVDDVRFISEAVELGIGIDNIVEFGRTGTFDVLVDVIKGLWAEVTLHRKRTSAQNDEVHGKIGQKVQALLQVRAIGHFEDDPLRLRVGGIERPAIRRDFAKKVRYLLTNANCPIDFREMGRAIGEPNAHDNQATWVRRLRDYFAKNWFSELPADKRRAAANKILVFEKSTGAYYFHVDFHRYAAASV